RGCRGGADPACRQCRSRPARHGCLWLSWPVDGRHAGRAGYGAASGRRAAARAAGRCLGRPTIASPADRRGDRAGGHCRRREEPCRPPPDGAGVTIEEAIRGLQRANTRARLKPLAKAPTASSPAEPPSATVGGELSGRELPVTQPATASAQTPATQSADEILAAARARIQKRSQAAA